MGVKDFSWLPRWLGNDSYYYLMSDLEKCGLTFPRPLFYATMDVLEEYYPDSVFGKGKLAYQNAEVLMGDEWRPMTNGLNLGMMNEYVSFMMSCLVSLWIEEENYAAEALMYNDDQVIRFPKEIISIQSEMMDAGLSWDNFMESAGCRVHKKKPFWSNRGVFLETYGNPQYSWKLYKTCSYVGNLFWALLATNIVEAKEYVSGVMDSLSEFYRERATEVLTTVISLWGHEFAPEEASYSYPIGWVRERNEDGELTLLSEIYNVNVLDKVQHGLIQVVKVPKPVLYSKKMRDASHFFNSHYKFFTDAICNDSVPARVKRLATAIKPPYLGLRKKAIAKIYSDWKDLRKAAFLAKRKEDPAMIIRSLSMSPKEYEVPSELLTKHIVGQGTIDVTYLDLDDEQNDLSIKEYIRFAQIYGQFQDIRVWVKDPDTEILRKASSFFSFPYQESELCLTLSQNHSREDIRYIIQKLGYGGPAASSIFFKDLVHWTPVFLPGKGAIVRFSEIIGGALRVTTKSWELANSLFPKYLIELAYVLDQVDVSREELLLVAEEAFWVFDTTFGENKDPPQEEENSIYYTASEGSVVASSYVTAESEDERTMLTKYLQYQIAGRVAQMGDLMEHSMRVEARMNQNLDTIFGASQSILDDDDMSEDGALGAMFGEDDGEYG
jgi:hypothetical protein